MVRTAGGEQVSSDTLALQDLAITLPRPTLVCPSRDPDAASVPDALGKPSPGTGRPQCRDTVARWPRSGSAAPAEGLSECAPGTPGPPFSCPCPRGATLAGTAAPVRSAAPPTDRLRASDTPGVPWEAETRIPEGLRTASLRTSISRRPLTFRKKSGWQETVWI